MLEQLKQAGYFREIVTNGQKTLVLRSPVRVIIQRGVLAELQKAYPPNEETGGILFAFPDYAGGLIVTGWKQLPNTIQGENRKTSYQPVGSETYRQQVIRSGGLPIRFHSHPVAILENPYDKQPLNFFQKTSSADRHNAYLPITIDGQQVVLPDGLLSANDRAGTDIRFYLYGGFVAPDSLKALLTSERVYIYFALLLAFFAYLLGGFKKAGPVLVLAGICSLIVFIAEKRPTGVKNSNGDLIISIP